MDVDPEIQRILSECPEVELSEFSPDPKAGGNGDGPAPAPFLPQAPAPVRLEGGQEASSPPLATETVAPEAPRRRGRKWTQAAPAEGSNGQGETRELHSVFLTIPDVARLFKMHPGSVWRLVCEGRLPAVKLGRVLIPAEAVTAFIEARKLKPKAWARRQKEPPGEA